MYENLQKLFKEWQNYYEKKETILERIVRNELFLIGQEIRLELVKIKENGEVKKFTDDDARIVDQVYQFLMYDIKKM